MAVFREMNWHGVVVFPCCKIFKMTSKMVDINDQQFADVRYHLDCWMGATAAKLAGKL